LTHFSTKNCSIHHPLLGQTLKLLPQKALIWEEKQTLILSDLHLGKVTHFRKSGIGLPSDVEQVNLDNLSQLMLNHKVNRVLLLGDLFHSQYNHQWEAFSEFINTFSDIAFILVKGNHDILPESCYTSARLTIYTHELIEKPFAFTHEPADDLDGYNVCGHLHPAIKLYGQGLQSMRLPCFHFTETRLVLPAFGAFTGCMTIKPGEGDNVYGIAEENVIKVL